ncbi:hypothetical protein T1E_1113 [Pseudomonas putida DOT-T1E]|uniref:Uncharacterized protein n=1 Tax=Pseudomonas putida (strain DOT-T1E) TaxID=1196325 RepID=I7C1R6_PSEPT|nr:hypothetical protein T1E_1113 [Pseudomonas putida DOT-T1E]
MAPRTPTVKGRGRWNGHPEYAKNAAASLELQASRKEHPCAELLSCSLPLATCGFNPTGRRLWNNP